jgi:ribosomal protein L9
MKINEAFMAQLIKTVTSGFGGNVTVRKRNGKTEVISCADMSKRILSEKQIEVNQTMKMASRYAKDQIAKEKSKKEAQLRLNVSSNKLYHALVKEYFKIDREEIEDPHKISTENPG